MDQEYLKTMHKELIKSKNNNKKFKMNPFVFVAPAIVMAIFTVIFSANIWKAVTVYTRAGASQKIPAHTLLYMVMFLATIYLIMRTSFMTNILTTMFENRIGFGVRGRFARSPSSSEVSCMIVLLRGMILFSLYLVPFPIPFVIKYILRIAW